MLNAKKIKYIFLAAFALAIAFPLVNIYLIFPSISKLLVNYTEEEAIRLAKYLDSTLVGKDKKIDHTINYEHVIKGVKDHFRLEEIKIYSADGYTVYSTDREEIGQINDTPYFKDKVRKGQVYTKEIHKNEKTLEGKVIRVDAVETYVPVMDGNKFIGAFEVYYDITSRNQAYNRTIFRSILLLYAVVFAFLIAIIAIFMKADRNPVYMKAGRMSRIYQSPFYLLGFLMISIFSGESAIMFLLSALPQMSGIAEALLDSSLLIMLLSPVFYIFLFRPLLLHIAMRREAEEGLRVSNNELEKRVYERTTELAEANRNLVAEIEDRTRIDEELKKAYRLTHQILEMAPFGIYSVNSKGFIEYVNKTMLTISGESRSQFIGVNAFELSSYREIDLSEKIRDTIKGSSFTIGPVAYTSHLGGKTTIRNFIGMSFEQEGEEKALIFVEDLTELEKTREALTLSTHDWEDTFNTITDMITIHDSDFNIIRANKAAEKILKLPDLEINKAIKCYNYYHGSGCPHEKCPGRGSWMTAEPVAFEIMEPHLNKYVEIRAIPRFDNNNRFKGLIHIVRDISKRKQDEDSIQTHLNRLNALRSIDKAIIGSIDLRITLNIFLEQVTKELQLDAAAVLLFNPKMQLLTYFTAKGFRTTALRRTNLKLGEGNAGLAAFDRRIVTVSDLKKQPESFAKSKHFRDEEFISYFAVPLIVKGQIRGVLELFHRSPMSADPEWLEFLEAIADQGAIAVDNSTLFDELQRSNLELTLAYDTTIEGWSHAMDLRDKETEGHSRRVTDMTLRIARELGVQDEALVHMRRGAFLHDMGKMGIPDSVLLKPGPLNDDEWKIMKQHPVHAYEMLSPIRYLRPSLEIPLYHHEKWDGTGYPKGLKGEEIPLAARVFAVVDVWDALSSARPYRAAWPKEKVIGHIRSLSGTHFDPAVVEIFMQIMSSTE